MPDTTPTPTSTASVATERAARYGKQLVSHLGRRNGGEWDDEAASGYVNFGVGELLLTTREGSLDLSLTVPVEDLDRMEDVAGRHLVRFGTRDELDVAWHRADGSTGTHQVKSED